MGLDDFIFGLKIICQSIFFAKLEPCIFSPAALHEFIKQKKEAAILIHSAQASFLSVHKDCALNP